jgi:hypothetical protein
MNPRWTSTLIVVFLCSIFTTSLIAGGEWYKVYQDGLDAMEEGEFKKASELFIEAIQGNPDDDENVRTYGMHSIEYFPHRELGICLYNMGDMHGARQELQISMKMEPSERAKQYLSQIGAGLPPEKKTEPKEDASIGVAAVPALEEKKETEMIVGKQTIKLVGERMGVAVLPFENKGASKDLGEIILDKMITVLWNQERFKVMERAALNQVLAEQSLGQSGVLDATTAAEIGKGIGVDAIIIGSVAAAPSGALSIDTRVIDTESAAIIVAHDTYTGSSDAQSVKNAVENLARKITESLPLVDGYVIRIDETELIIDVGRNGGMKKGMKCVIYKEGAPIKHPITGEILGKETDVIAEVLVTDVFDKYSVAKQLAGTGGTISIGDKFITK